MKARTLFLTIAFVWVLALADHSPKFKSIQFYSEELLRTREGIQESGYTSTQALKERLARLILSLKDQKEVAFPLVVEEDPMGGIFPKTNVLPEWSQKISTTVDIPDMPINQEFYTSSFNQSDPSVCMFPDKSFITVWRDERNGDIDIFAQKNSFDGTAVGYNVEVGEEDFPKDQYLPSVSILNDTSLVVAWIDEESFGIYGKRFSKNLLPLGEAFQVDDSPFPYTTWSPAISSGLDGKFIVTWSDIRGGKNNIYARRFDSEGTPLEASFKVNDDEGSTLHTSPHIAAGLSGDFVVVWEDYRNTDADIYAQRFDSSGVRIGDNILVNLDSLSEDQYMPSVSVGPHNRFMVIWIDLRHGDEAVFTRSLSFDDPMGDTVLFSINSDIGSVVSETPQVDSDMLGRFTIAWTEYTPSDPTVYAQRYDSLGTVLNDAIIITSLQSTGERHGLTLSTNLEGSFAVAWMDKHAGNYDIYAQPVSSNWFLSGNNRILNDDDFGANQNLPQVVVRADGGFVVVWEDFRRGNSDVFMRRFDQNASPWGDDQMVNDSTGRIYHGRPDVACNTFGNILVVWEDTRESLLNIYAQLYDDSGDPNGSNFRIDCEWMTNSSFPVCEIFPAGDFVVVWSSTSGSYKNIYGRLFSSGGEPLDDCFKINDDGLNVDHLSPRIAMDSSGKFVVAWQDRREGQDRIYAQRFASDGSKVAANFAVYSNRSNPVQYNADLDLNQNGDFVVTWTESFLSSTMIFAQRYDSSGAPVDTNIMVVDDPYACPENPKVRLTDDGYFTVAWTDQRTQGSDVYFQTFLNGLPRGSNRRVNAESSALQSFPDIDVWSSYLYSVWRDNRIPGWGFSVFFNTIDFTETGVEDNPEEGSMLPGSFLYQNYPNPFNPVTTIQYTVWGKQNQPVPVTLRIYNVLGQSVRTLVDEEKWTGRYQITWDGRDDKGLELPSGIYLCRLKTMDHQSTVKMLLLK